MTSLGIGRFALLPASEEERENWYVGGGEDWKVGCQGRLGWLPLWSWDVVVGREAMRSHKPWSEASYSKQRVSSCGSGTDVAFTTSGISLSWTQESIGNLTSILKFPFTTQGLQHTVFSDEVPTAPRTKSAQVVSRLQPWIITSRLFPLL